MSNGEADRFRDQVFAAAPSALDLVGRRSLGNVLFAFGGVSVRKTLVRALFTVGLMPALLFLVSWREGTLVLQGDALGLSEHYGFLALFVVHPLVVVFFPIALERFVRAFALMANTIDVNDVLERGLQQEVLAAISGTKDESRTPVTARVLSLLAYGIGLVGFLANAWNTTRAANVYHHDVWDSWQHPWSYAAGRTYFFVCWAVAVPIVISNLAWLCLLIGRMYWRLRGIGPFGAVALRAPGPDHADSMYVVNSAVLRAVFNVLPFAVCIGAIIASHRITVPLVLGALGWAVLASCLYLGPLVSAHLAMKRKKDGLLRQIEFEFLNVTRGILDGQRNPADSRYADELRSAHDFLKSISTFPFDPVGVSAFIGMNLITPLSGLLRSVVGKLGS